jgi:hypothetical protein
MMTMNVLTKTTLAYGFALAGVLGFGWGCDVETETELGRELDDQHLRSGSFCGGIASIPCPAGESCVDDPNDDCNPNKGGADCGGICVGPAPCGGFAGLTCQGKGQVCVDDPGDDCDPGNGGADCGGICVAPVFCGGFGNFPCEDGYLCVDDPRDDCDPNNGGADCSGLCVPDPDACVGFYCEQ